MFIPNIYVLKWSDKVARKALNATQNEEKKLAMYMYFTYLYICIFLWNAELFWCNVMIWRLVDSALVQKVAPESRGEKEEEERQKEEEAEKDRNQ